MIYVNGKVTEYKERLSELLKELNINKKNIAILVNDEIIKKSDWDNFKLKEGDKVEIVGFVGGG